MVININSNRHTHKQHTQTTQLFTVTPCVPAPATPCTWTDHEPQSPSSTDSSPLSSSLPGTALGGAGIIREMLSIMEPPPRAWSSFLSSFLLSFSLSLPLMAFLLRPRAADKSLRRSPPPELISAASSFLAFLSFLRFFAFFNPALEAPPMKLWNGN